MTQASTSHLRPGPALGRGDRFQPFGPPRWLRNPHLQTILGRYWPTRRTKIASTYHELRLDDGDRLAVFDTLPGNWEVGRPAALLVHGLGGSAQAPYISRLAAKLSSRGVRCVRLNLRGAGPGFGIARKFYNAGRTGDVRRSFEWLAARCPGSPIALIGFSLGGNLALKLAAEASADPLVGLDCVLAASVPIDLAACCEQIRLGSNRIYDRNFLRSLRAEVFRIEAEFPGGPASDLASVRSLFEFDDRYTAPRDGFSGARHYYSESSASSFLPRIEVPGLVVQARDDPFIPVGCFERARFPPGLALELISHGGHLGFLDRRVRGRDRHWLDSRLMAWLVNRWQGLVV
jgi:predicted alpha/beta-fold hydrolase